MADLLLCPKCGKPVEKCECSKKPMNGVLVGILMTITFFASARVEASDLTSPQEESCKNIAIDGNNSTRDYSECPWELLKVYSGPLSQMGSKRLSVHATYQDCMNAKNDTSAANGAREKTESEIKLQAIQDRLAETETPCSASNECSKLESDVRIENMVSSAFQNNNDLECSGP